MRQTAKMHNMMHSDSCYPVINLTSRLYFGSFENKKETDKHLRIIYLFIEDFVNYAKFSHDFGPIDISATINYLRLVQTTLDKFNGSMVVIASCDSSEQRLNAAVIAGAYLILYERMPLDVVYRILTPIPVAYTTFIDASDDETAWRMDLKSALSGFAIGFQYQFFSMDTFDTFKHDSYGRVEYGDLNWIVPNKLMAFACPVTLPHVLGYAPNSTTKLAMLFVHLKVSCVVQTNEFGYNPSDFTKFDIEHHHLFFPDMTPPPDEIVLKFLKLCLSCDSIAVHCKSGLGRTGSLIACYMMWKWKLPAEACIAWLRLARPGSILTTQGHWLIHKCRSIQELTQSDIDNNNVDKLSGPIIIAASPLSARRVNSPIKSATITATLAAKDKKAKSKKKGLRKI
uniref:TYR_PHOSPHATASE_2 domain-containing protein n=1 Tax=Rhabditophanes sp. KR3021 TaxID=114890 RepID=A0AC35TT90_9BILA